MRLLHRAIALLAMTYPVIIGCGGFGLATAPAPTMIIKPTWTISPLPSPTVTDTLTPTFIPTETLTASPSPTFTLTPTLTPEPQYIFQGPGDVTVPILLYHHIGISQKESTYYISTDEFDRQMNLLYASGYRTISVEQLVSAIRHGAELPVKPILLTFDDGGETVYTDAFPILEKYGFTGTVYIVHYFVGVSLYMDRDQIRELYNAGWEVGSHGLSHLDLTSRPGKQMEEIVNSRSRLESYLDVPVLSFAYPFGAYDKDSLYLVKYAGYAAAMGLGEEVVQGDRNIYYLYRQSITSDLTLETFASLLPWQSGLTTQPAVTVVP